MHRGTVRYLGNDAAFTELMRSHGLSGAGSEPFKDYPGFIAARWKDPGYTESAIRDAAQKFAVQRLGDRGSDADIEAGIASIFADAREKNFSGDTLARALELFLSDVASED